MDLICKELINMCDELKLDLILTNGGTGFSKRDVTPEATLKVIERQAPGIAEAMRQMSINNTEGNAFKSCGRNKKQYFLIINLPGSPKAAVENLSFVLLHFLTVWKY